MKKGFLIVAHGSRKEEANQQVMALIKTLSNYFQSDMFEPAFMEQVSPSIEDGIKALTSKNIDQLIVYPFFLFKGMHFSKDIPNLIKAITEKSEKKIPFKILDPVGQNPAMVDLVREELYDEVMDQFEFEKIAPQDIEERSMEHIEKNLNGREIPSDQKPIVKRVIHTTGDFDFLKSMVFHKDAVSAGLKAVKEKKIIYTDVTMVQAGINKKFGHDVRCVLNDPDVISQANNDGITKTAASIKSLGHKLDGNIIAIGNAPTALMTLVDMVKNDGVKPALIVGIPVGFVNAKESKSYLRSIEDVPYITNNGQKGGSTVAAAIVNALIKTAFDC